MAALTQIVWLLRIFILRIDFPMDIEWLEGHSLEEAWRSTHAGEPLYGDRTLGHQTQIYPPLYFMVVGVLGRVVGLDYATGRSVSIVAFLAGCGAVLHVVMAHAKDRKTGVVVGLVAVAAICAGFPVVYGWYDIARVDSMAIALVIGAGAVVSGASPPTTRRAVVAGALLAMAVYTKQTTVVFVPWLAAFVFVRSKRAGLWLAGVFTVLCGVALVALQLATHGWFLRWMTLAAAQSMEIQRLGDGQLSILKFAPYLPLYVLLIPFMAGRRWLTPTTALWCGLFASAVPASFLPFLKVGGAPNNFIAIVFFTPPAVLLAVLDCVDGPARGWKWRPAALAAFLALASAYLVLALYPHDLYVPTVPQRAAARSLDALVASLHGGVVIPSHPFLARRHDREGRQVLNMGYIELDTAHVPGVHVKDDLEHIGAAWLILTDPGGDVWIRDQVAGLYDLDCRIDPGFASYATLQSNPRLLYRASRARGGSSQQDVPVCAPADR